MRTRRFLAAIPAVLLCLAVPGLAQPGPSDGALSEADIKARDTFIDNMLVPADRDLRPAVLLALEEADSNQAIAKINALVPLLSDPSPMRVFLVSRRASMRVLAGQVDAGRAEYEELIERFPKFDGVKIDAIDSLAYGSAADVAARLWIELADTSPGAAMSLPGYTLGALTGNLDAKNDVDTKFDLFVALDRIGFDPGAADLRNDIQLGIFSRAAEESAKEQAVAALRKITDPSILLGVANQSRYRDYWGNVDLDAASLNAQGAEFLRELEKGFLEAENGTAAGHFLRTAAAFGSARTVATQYSGLLARLTSQSGESQYVRYGTPFWVSPIAFAWVAAGAPDNAEEEFKRALTNSAGLLGTIDLNVSANYAALLLDLDRPREALVLIEPAIAKLTSADQSAGALAEMHSVRLRAYHQLGEAARASDSRLYIEGMGAALLGTHVRTMLMIGEKDTAKAAIIAGLRSAEPEQAIGILQYSLFRPRSEAQAKYEEKLDQLREDPEVLDVLAPVGRIVVVAPIDGGPFDHAATVGAFPLVP